jgi:hypothetical protein
MVALAPPWPSLPKDGSLGPHSTAISFPVHRGIATLGQSHPGTRRCSQVGMGHSPGPKHSSKSSASPVMARTAGRAEEATMAAMGDWRAKDARGASAHEDWRVGPACTEAGAAEGAPGVLAWAEPAGWATSQWAEGQAAAPRARSPLGTERRVGHAARSKSGEVKLRPRERRAPATLPCSPLSARPAADCSAVLGSQRQSAPGFLISLSLCLVPALA